ncbi:MAG: hypothetical protein IH614_03975 [Desulfuromonadales bacterium]|nr:hypothetical protein [Desulfuromonadales bacterium]
MRRLGSLLGFFLLLVGSAWAASIPVGSELIVELPPLSERWQVSALPPDFLVKEIAEHLGHELAAEGKTPSEAEILKVAEKRLAANEAFVCNPASGSCLLIDFSPLRPDEKAPGRRQVAASARYAAEGLADEEGLSDLQQTAAKANLPGSRHVYRIDARYRQHGEPRQFIGYVGFAQPSWFYLYYTDSLADPADLAEMEKLFQGVVVRPAGGR